MSCAFSRCSRQVMGQKKKILNMKRKSLILLILVVHLAPHLKSQISDSLLNPALKLDLTLIDAPYQNDASQSVNNGKISISGYLQGYANPSMSQALSVTTSMYNSAHYGIDKAFFKNEIELEGKRKLLYLMSLFATDYVLVYAPGGDGWLHEEFHRAVLTRNQVNSFNDMNTFPIGAEAVSVNSVLDEDLVRFKREKPYDFIRMHVAGIEGEYLLIDKLQKENFFYEQNRSHEFMYLLTTINAISYVAGSASSNFVDKLTDKMNAEEAKIKDRDFTGIDFTAWAYDLFNPSEEYNKRGLHPLGNGIDRYIKVEDLSKDAHYYLKKQARRSFLNLLSTSLFYRNTVVLNDKYVYNVYLRHLLTSFGDDISFNYMLMGQGNRFVFKYHHASNYIRFFPALEAEWFEKYYKIGNINLLFTPKLLVGVQPLKQSFTTKKSAFLGNASCRIELLSNKIQPWVELDAKTEGWVAGNPYLEKNFSFKMGVSMRVKN